MQIPFDGELEETVIASMLLDPECVVDVMEHITSDNFYIPKYKMMVEKIFQVWSEDPIQLNLMLLAPWMEKNEINASRLTDVMASIPSVAVVEAQAKRIRDLAALRGAMRAAGDLIGCYHLRDSDDIREAILKAESDISKVSQTTVKSQTVVTMQEALLNLHERIEARSTQTGLAGISTGLTDLDLMTSGMQKTDLIILAARPSMGKTAFMNHLARHAAEKEEGAVAIFSAEMSSDAITTRMVATEGRINLQDLNSGTFNDDDYHKYTMAQSNLYRTNIIIDDQAAIKVAEMRAKLKKIQRERGLSLILVDYLGMLGSPEKGMSRYEQVSENTRLLKNLAKDFNVPVVCLSQLSRKVEERQDKRPMLSDLRESGEVEQTADLTMFLYRDDYYDKNSEKKNVLEIIIAKQRNGPTGTVEVVFQKEYGAITNLAHPWEG